MKNISRIVTLTTASLLAAVGLIQAHHGYAAFDTSVSVTLVGTVTEFHWTNPHCILDFEVKDNKGQTRAWHGEMGSPGNLAPKGWTRTTLEPGDKVTISGFAGKNNVASIWVKKVLLPDGKELKIDAGN